MWKPWPPYRHTCEVTYGKMRGFSLRTAKKMPVLNNQARLYWFPREDLGIWTSESCDSTHMKNITLEKVARINSQVSSDISLPAASEGNILPGTLILLDSLKKHNALCSLPGEEQTVAVIWMNSELLRDVFLLLTSGPSNVVLQSQPKSFPAWFSLTDLPFSRQSFLTLHIKT